ncbi:MAG: tetratricopeptide repeat protein [Nitrosopumilus sp.]|nr:tetratricopeptide repeat protein [Nitrosopumilus sp.]
MVPPAVLLTALLPAVLALAAMSPAHAQADQYRDPGIPAWVADVGMSYEDGAISSDEIAGVVSYLVERGAITIADGTVLDRSEFQDREPTSYVEMYMQDAEYRESFDAAYPGHSIYYAVGLPEPAAPGHTAVLGVIGLAAFGSGMSESALVYSERILVIDQYDPSGLGIAAASLNDLGRHDELPPYFERILELDPGPDDLLVHELRARVLGVFQMYDEALDHYQRVIELDPENSEVLVNMGDILFELERYDEAIDRYNDALQWDPDNEEIITKRGKASAMLQAQG